MDAFETNLKNVKRMPLLIHRFVSGYLETKSIVSISMSNVVIPQLTPSLNL